MDESHATSRGDGRGRGAEDGGSPEGDRSLLILPGKSGQVDYAAR